MFNTTETAETLGVSAGRVRQLLAARTNLGDEIKSLSIVEQISAIPEPVNAMPLMFDEWEVLRTRAYRDGGHLARRVELAAWEDAVADPGAAARLFEILQYPAHDPNFTDWILTTINTEIERSAS